MHDNYPNYSVLTPYLIPTSLQGRKVVNLGDGFILRAIERLIGRFSIQNIHSPRIALSGEIIQSLKQNRVVILAGANQLNDRYTVWPGLTAERIHLDNLRLIPFAIGLHGEKGYTDKLSDATRSVLLALHEKIEYSSWRCPRTVAYLNQQLPELSGQLIMTGCPVVYDTPLLEGRSFYSGTRKIAVTVTERHDFWARETRVIDFVAKHFPRSQRFLVLHQNYSPPQRFEHFRHRWGIGSEASLNEYQKLRKYAVCRGFRVICPKDADDCISFYRHMDFHVGSRLHAHLLFLSRAKRSMLVPVDDRALGMAEFLGFPLYAPDELAEGLEFDFNIVRERATQGYEEMKRFLKSLRA